MHEVRSILRTLAYITYSNGTGRLSREIELATDKKQATRIIGNFCENSTLLPSCLFYYETNEVSSLLYLLSMEILEGMIWVEERT